MIPPPDLPPPLGRVVDAPPPEHPPRYDRTPVKTRERRWSAEDAVDGAFFLAGAVLVVWLGVLLVVRDLRLSPLSIAYLVVFWLLVAYLGLPRLQEVLTRIYVPDYFIGRTVTGVGVLGDPVNLALDGSEGAIHATMTRAGWTRADPITLRSSWGIVVSTVLRRSYPGAPVSPLFLFGRQQAFAYEIEVDGNAAQRHHVRFWPVPQGWLLPGGYEVGWLAGATYDRAVGLSLFTLQVTHKVDADVDVERDFVVGSVRYAEHRAALRVIDHFSDAFSSRKGGGDVVRSDGTLPVLDLTAVPAGTSPGPVVSVPGAPASWRLPPPALLATVVLSVAQAALTLIGLAALALGTSRSGLLPGVGDGRLALSGLAAAFVVAGWVSVLRHSRLARTLLMAVCTLQAVDQLTALAGAPRIGILVAASTSLSVLTLIAVSSSAARRWVTPPRR